MGRGSRAFYEYDPSRSGKVPLRLLDGFTGVLQSDGYAGYDEVGSRPGVVHVGCWVHARRKFDEAVKSLRANERKASSAKETLALQTLRQIAALYAIERTIAEATPEERLRVRGERFRPLIEALRGWLTDALPRVAPQTLTGKALAYLEPAAQACTPRSDL